MHNSLIIAKNKVPQYLQYGLLFECGRRDFVVPSNCLKPDISIKSDKDLRHLLDSIQFWKVYRMPEEVFTFVEANIDVRLLDHWSREVPKLKMCIKVAVVANITAPDKTLILVSALRTAQNFWKVGHEQMGLPLAPACWNLVAVLDDAPSATFLQLKGIPVSISTFVTSASLSGSLKCLKYAHSQGWEMSHETALCAAEEGHQAVLQFLHQTCGIELTLETMVCAARFDRLDVVCYLHESGCPWDASVCADAARSGHLRCLEYAHQQGCPWDEYTVLYAKSNNRADCLEYALENGCPVFLADDLVLKLYMAFTCLIYLLVLVKTLRRRHYMVMRCVQILAKLYFHPLEEKIVSLGITKYMLCVHMSPLFVYSLVSVCVVVLYSISFLFVCSVLFAQSRSRMRNCVRCMPEVMLAFAVLTIVMHQNFRRVDF